MEHYYNLLEVKSSMSIKEIKKQYIKLMKKNHPDRSGQDEECKKITEAYQKIVKYKLNMNSDDRPLIPLGYTEFDNTALDMDYVHDKIKLSNKKLEVILELNDIKRNDKSVFEKVFDFFFDLDSDDSDEDSENSD